VVVALEGLVRGLDDQYLPVAGGELIQVLNVIV
jgi:hypothetical protein